MTRMKKDRTPNNTQHNTIPRKKLILFRCLALSLPFLLLAAIEGGFRLFSSHEGDPYVNISPLYFFARNISNGTEYVQIDNKLAHGNQTVRFPIHKSKETIRIFCVGGSACAGWPMQVEQTFSTYLKKSLESALPDHKIEVINASAHGFASYRVRCIFDQLLDLSPDAILVYSGNNEFLEKRDYTVVSKLITVQKLRALIEGSRTRLEQNELRGAALTFYKKIKKQALELRADPKQFQAVKAHYRYSISQMVRGARAKGVPVLLCTIPVNERDWLPTVSHNPLKGQELSVWQQSYEEGMRCYLTGRYKEGVAHMERAVEFNPDHAESYFWLGRLIENEDPVKARDCFSKARDLDYNGFRAISFFNDSVRQIASDYDNSHLVDLDNIFNQEALGAAPGFDLFLDYVHPNTKGHLLIAKEVYEVIADSGLLEVSMAPVPFPGDVLAQDRNGNRYDSGSDISVQERMFSLYIQNHQEKAAIEKVRQIHLLTTGKELIPGQLLSESAWPTQLAEGYNALLEYETLLEKQILGPPVDPDRMAASKHRLDAYYEKWYGYGSF